MKKDLRKGIDFIGISCVALCHDGLGNFLMHKRSQNARDEHGKWDIAGGSLEWGETFEECIIREIKEEYNTEVLELKRIRVFEAFREHQGQKTHWVGIYFMAKVDPRQTKIGEPKKMADLKWFDPDHLPDPLHSQFHKIWPITKKRLLKHKKLSILKTKS